VTLAKGTRVVISDDSIDQSIVGTVEGIVPGTEDRGDRVVYFVRWDGDPDPDPDRRYPGELIVKED
jgi:hypothetical protein